MLKTKSQTGFYQLEVEQKVSVPIEEVWEFFSSPKNLEKITPDDVQFKITSDIIEDMYEGQIISYKIKLFKLFPVSWITEITKVKEERYFIDEQRFGPYKMWHHEHWFEPDANGGTIMKDRVSYKIPYGFIGRFAHVLFVKKKLVKIFNHRYQTVEQLFNSK